MHLVDPDSIPPGIQNFRAFVWAREDMEAGLSWYESAKKRKVARNTMRGYFRKLRGK